MTAVSPLTTQVVTREVEWDSLEREWRELFAVSPSASSSLDWDWMRGWWRAFGAQYAGSTGGLRIVIFRRDGALCGVLPLYLKADERGAKKLCFICAGETIGKGVVCAGESSGEGVYSEYLDVLVRSGCEAEVEVAARAALSRNIPGLRWDASDLGLLSGGGMVSRICERRAMLRRFPPVFSVERRYPSPRADMSGGFESYLSRLSSNARQQFRRLLRQVEKEKLEFRVAASAEEGNAFFDELVRLHQARWLAAGQPGAFASPSVVAFHRGVIESGIQSGRVVIARMAAGSEPIALLYGFVVGPKFDFYQSGIAEAGAIKLGSPGMAAHLLLMRDLASRGVVTYDFLAGESTYKDRLATGQGELVRTVLYSLGPRGIALLAGEVLQRVWKRVSRAAWNIRPEARQGVQYEARLGS